MEWESFDSTEDHEMYKRLMVERRRIQRQMEKCRKQRVVRQLEDRERGFQLYTSGANEERVDDVRRREGTQEKFGGGREWQVGTVEIRGGGVSYRTSPSCRTSPCSSRAQSVDSDSSRPNSTNSVDRDTRGVLKMMHGADQNQLSLLRESLSNHLRREIPAGRPAASPGRRPSNTSIASAIQAENELAKQFLAGPQVSPSWKSRPSSSRPIKDGRRLPLSPESLLESGPPSVLSPPRQSGAATPTCHGVRTQSTSVPEEILDRVSRLEKRKQHALLRVLENLESERDDLPPPSRAGEASAVEWLEGVRGASPQERQPESSSSSEDGIRVRVLSNYGDPRQFGISEIEALDDEGQTIRIPPVAVSLHGAQSGSSLSRLV